MIPVTVGICAYNEAGNIERSVRSLYSQRTDGISIEEVIVVSSGSTDGTDSIVRRLLPEYGNLSLLCQERREGKNSAINLLLDSKSTEIVVLLNADNAFGSENSLRELLAPFRDPRTGITGGHPVPTNDPRELVGFASHMVWSMHHHTSMVFPKIGELVAFRDIGTRLPVDSQSDEDMLRMELERNGYISAYSPDAVILNRGPDTVQDFVKQRTRVNIGERYMKKNFDYDIPTWNYGLLARAALGMIRDLGPHPFKIAFAASLEIVSRGRASFYVSSNRGDMSVWDPVGTTKRL